MQIVAAIKKTAPSKILVTQESVRKIAHQVSVHMVRWQEIILS